MREDLEHEAKHAAEREVRGELMKQLATRLPFEVPASLVEREIDRRLEEFARRLIDQKIDPRQAGIDWNAFRESQREVGARSGGRARWSSTRLRGASSSRSPTTEVEAGDRALCRADRPDAGGRAGGARKRGRAVARPGGPAPGEVN